MELKEGQVYKRIEKTTPAFTKGRYYTVMLDGRCEPYLESDGSGRWYEDDITLERFELVEKENDEMIKKGDIVKVMSKDRSCGLDYEVGTNWVVNEDVGIDNLVQVFDPRQADNEGILYLSKVKKLDLSSATKENKPEPLPVLISVDDLLKDIDEHDYTLIQLKAYLNGYLKGGRF